MLALALAVTVAGCIPSEVVTAPRTVTSATDQQHTIGSREAAGCPALEAVTAWDPLEAVTPSGFDVQDHRNPTADALAAWRSDLAVTFSSGRLADDAAMILGASHVALAYGTFTWMLPLLGNAQVLENGRRNATPGRGVQHDVRRRPAAQ